MPIEELCIMWNLWLEINKWVFDGIEHSNYVIKQHILRSLFDWMQVLGGIPLMSFVEFIDCLCL
jgi:hypothetical protein